MNNRLIQKLKTYWTFGILVGYIGILAGPLWWWYSLIPGKREKRQAAFHSHIARFFKFYVFHCVCGAKVELRNESGEDFEKPALIIANHQSLLDLPATLMLKDKMVAMTGEWVWNSRIYGRVINFADFMPSSMPMDEMMAHVRDCMSRGYSVLIFPEGTRSEDLQVHKFRRGAFHIAEQLGCDVVPVTLHGTGRMLPKNDFCLTPGRIIVEVGQRVKMADGIMGEDHGSMTRYWHKWFVQRYAELEAELGAES